MTDNTNMDIILASHFAGEKLSPEQETVLIEWIVEHKEEYQKLERLMSSADGSQKRTRSDVREAWMKIEPQLKVVQRTKVRSFMRILSYAAIVLLVVGLGFDWITRTEDEGVFYVNSEFSVKTISLPDSSSVMLYPNARLTYRLNKAKNERMASLDGKAFFKVKPNSQQAFVVENRHVHVRVLGTSFLVSEEEYDVTGVFVREGLVEVSAGEKTVKLTRNEKVQVKGDSLLKSQIVHPEVVFKDNIKSIVYKNTPLSQVLADLEQEFKVEIVCDESLLPMRISTRLLFVGMEEILHELSFICNCRYDNIGNNRYKLFVNE